MKLSEKYIDFIKHNAPVEFLEGTTAAGKTTVGVFKFMLKVAKSDKKLHILAGLDLGTIEKNIINKDLGIIDIFGNLVEYNSSGKGKHSLPHIIYRTSKGEKIIYILGYDNKARWKKALGGQYGCMYVDEMNIADIEFLRESTMRCDYLIGTFNPDDPNLPVYKEYINHSRPIEKYKHYVPEEINKMLTEPKKSNWTYWFFSFEDNLGLTKEKIVQIKENTPIGTKIYKNKIQGLRGKSTGLVFSNFEPKRHVVNTEYIKKQEFKQFTCGVDTSYSKNSDDTIAFEFGGITKNGIYIVLDELVLNNKDLNVTLAPSDTAVHLIKFLNKNTKEYGLALNIFVDCADQATLTELSKYKRNNGCVYIFNNSYKKITIIDRINLQLGWLAKDKYLVQDKCKEHIKELELYSWKETKDEPEDKNDHTINASQYGWIPYKNLIGGEENKHN